MSFGTESGKSDSGGTTLAGLIVSKAFQSRKEAKKRDRKDKKKKKKTEGARGKSQQKASSDLLGGALSSITNIFKPDKGKPEEVKTQKPRTSGGATGLAKILTHGFGSLTADTLGLASGLASITDILNQQLKAQSFTATGVQTITGILSDQVENQSSIISGVKSLRPGGGGKGGRSMFGTSKSRGVSNDTLTGFISAKVNEAIKQAAGVGAGGLAGSALRGALTNPSTYMYLLAAVGSYMRMKEVEKMKPFVDQTSQQIQTENSKSDTPWYKKLGNMFAGQALSSPQGPSNQIGLPSPGGMYSEGGVVNYSSGVVNFAAGGTTNSMIGEAGKEVVVDLNDRSARNMLKSSPSNVDPGMKASGASTLAVVDQFIKGMGPLGAPVSQSLAPDIANLSRTFGMSQTLPNLRIGGGKFKEDGNAKKNRDKFLEDLIAGSLKSLDAKKKTKEKATEKPNPTTDKPTPPGVTPPASNPTTPAKPSSNPSSSKPGEPMENGRYTDPRSGAGTAIPDVSAATGEQLKNKKTNQHFLPFRPDSKWHDKYHILLDAANGSFQIWEKPGILNLVPKMIFQGKKDNKGQIQNNQIASEAFNEVRAFMRINMPETAKNTFNWVTDTDISNANKARSNGNQQLGGTVKPEPKFDKGGGVQKPWWDFLGWVTGMKSVEQGKTGVYSNSPMGRMAENTARTNAMMKELGYEKGGSMFGVEGSNLTPIDKLEKRVKVLETFAELQLKSKPPEVKPKAPTTRPSATPVAATNQESSDMSSAAIINVIAPGGGGSIPVGSSESAQTTTDYISNPWPGGLAGVVCTSPWSVV